jgi:hypothetical protein
MALTRLADVRDRVELHPPAEHRARNAWHYVATCLPARLAARMTPGRRRDCSARGAGNGGRQMPAAVEARSGQCLAKAFLTQFLTALWRAYQDIS